MTRTVGVEEELLVVDQETGRPVSVAGRILDQAARVPGGPGADAQPGGTLEAEFQQQQVETDTPPRTSLSDLESDLRQWRDVAVLAARKVGARVVASGTSPVEVTPRLVRTDRYQQIAEHYGLTAAEHLTCGCHVHVSVESDDEGAAALNRIRPWLPTVLAISANSPFWQGQDSGYASFRSQAMVRWPSVGPPDLFESGEHYRATVAEMVATEVVMDEGMVYYDARLSSRYPTLEVRVADVCLDIRDTVLVTGLSRALVDTAVADAAAGRPAPAVSSSMLRLATWQASREGLDGTLLDPGTLRPEPAEKVVADLFDHVRPALAANGDEALVAARLDQVLALGTGARRQRATLERTGRMADVVAHLARVTAGHDE